MGMAYHESLSSGLAAQQQDLLSGSEAPFPLAPTDAIRPSVASILSVASPISWDHRYRSHLPSYRLRRCGIARGVLSTSRGPTLPAFGFLRSLLSFGIVQGHWLLFVRCFGLHLR